MCKCGCGCGWLCARVSSVGVNLGKCVQSVGLVVGGRVRVC